MGFIHCHQRDFLLFGKVPKQLRLQSFRSHIKQLVSPFPGGFQGGEERLGGQGTVDVGGRDTCLFQRLHLILHQGDQRGDHQGDPWEQQGRDLVAEGFAGAGGHDTQHIPALQQGIDENLLTGTETFVSKILFQGCISVHGWNDLLQAVNQTAVCFNHNEKMGKLQGIGKLMNCIQNTKK